MRNRLLIYIIYLTVSIWAAISAIVTSLFAPLGINAVPGWSVIANFYGPVAALCMFCSKDRCLDNWIIVLASVFAIVCTPIYFVCRDKIAAFLSILGLFTWIVLWALVIASGA